jgi:hypothetical protein
MTRLIAAAALTFCAVFLPACATVDVNVDLDRYLSVDAGGESGRVCPSRTQAPRGAERGEGDPLLKDEDQTPLARRVARMNRELAPLFRAGDYERCQRVLDRILKIDPDNHVAWYNLACVHSRRGKREEAVAALRRSVEEGFTHFRHMERDPDLAPVRNEEGYRALLARKGELLRAHAIRIRDRLRRRLGGGFLYDIDHGNKLVFATNVDRKTLDELKAYLTDYAEAQWRNLFTHRFEQYVTVVIPRTWRYRGLGGFYRHDKRMLACQTIGMALTHEFTHALHFSDQNGLAQRHPIWIAEGLATLFESSRVEAGRVIPLPNRRLNALKALLRTKRTLRLAELLRTDYSQFVGRANACYAQSRYLMMYLFERGLLKEWYDTYTAGYAQDPSGARALEEVLGKDLAKIEAEWRDWVLGREAPPVRLVPHQAYMGVLVRSQVDGLRIMRVVPGSGADKAPLHVGDLIAKVNGRRVADPAALLSLVDQCEVGDTLTIEIRRGGKYRTVDVTLGAMPQRIPPPAVIPQPASMPTRKAA